MEDQAETSPGLKPFQVFRCFLAYNFRLLPMVSLLSQIEDVGKTLQGVVDLVSEIIRHGSHARDPCLFEKQFAPPLFSNPHGCEIGEHLHGPVYL
jgi:hypothetical protein